MKLRDISLVGVVLAVGSAAVPTLAFDPPTGTRLGERGIRGLQRSEEEADFDASKLAGCLVVKRSAQARAVMEASTTEAGSKSSASLFNEISCLQFISHSNMADSSAISIPRDVLRGKLAEALLKNQRTAISALPALPLAKDYSRPWFAATTRNPVIDEMGACVADTNPNGVAGILATSAYSKEEAAAFGSVMPSLGPCLRAGAKLQANRQALRAALADALYQRLTRPAPAASEAYAGGAK